MTIENVIERQLSISLGEAPIINGLPRYSIYSICNLRGGCGKTTLAFNLSFLANELLSVDLCPQGNLSFFYDKEYFKRNQATIYDLILSHLIPGSGSGTNNGINVGATNEYFKNNRCFYLPSSADLYLLPSLLNSAINMASQLSAAQKSKGIKDICCSLKTEIEKEMKTANVSRCIIDTSPFLAGGTELSLYASDALIIPVRTDQQSINSLELLLKELSSPDSSYNRNVTTCGFKVPKVHLVILTHCGWSTKAGSVNKPNRQTFLYLQRIYDILSRRSTLLSSENVDDHLVLLDDLLGTGRISSALSKPVNLLNPQESKYIDRVKVCVNNSVEKCKKQLLYINNLLWPNDEKSKSKEVTD